MFFNVTLYIKECFMLYVCGYPIEHTFDVTGGNIFYQILIGSTVIYNGTLLNFNTANTTVTIDISDICREYLETFYENLIFTSTIASNVPSQNGIGSIVTFTVSSENNPNGGLNADVDYPVVYDYNTDFIFERPDVDYTSNPLFNEVDIRQRVNASGYNNTGTAQPFYYQINNGTSIPVNIPSASSFKLYSIDLSSIPGLNVGDTITIGMGTPSSIVGSNTYKVVSACRGRFALYYVNKRGALDQLLCSLRDVESWNPNRFDSRLYDNRKNRMDWQLKRLHMDIRHLWTLNFHVSNDEKSRQIDELFNSPKVFLHDLDNNIINSVVINTNTINVLEYRYDGIPIYQMQVEESQYQIRK